MNKNIHVDTGIGYIEKNFGTINLNSNQNEAGFKVRLDFKDVEKEIFQLYQYGKVFSKNNIEYWHHLKNNEDFDRVYDLDDNQKRIFTDIYSEGRNCAISMSDSLLRINEDFSEYRDLTSVINNLESSRIRNITLLEETLKKSENLNSSMGNPFYSVNEMNLLYKEQVDLLKAILKVVAQLRESDLYKKENLLLVENKGVVSSVSTSPSDANETNTLYQDAPEKIKTLLWFWNLTQKHPITGVFLGLVFIALTYVLFFYEYLKHDINIVVLHTEVAQEEKIKIKHIFDTGGTFVSLLHDMRDNKNVEFSGYKYSLQENFSALGFNGSKLFKDTNIDQLTWIKNYNDVRSEFEGYIDRNFAKYRSLYDAGLNLSVYINSGEKIYLEDFIQDWKKFQENSDFVTPEFDTSKIKSPSDAIKIYLEIQKWLKT